MRVVFALLCGAAAHQNLRASTAPVAAAVPALAPKDPASNVSKVTKEEPAASTKAAATATEATVAKATPASNATVKASEVKEVKVEAKTEATKATEGAKERPWHREAGAKAKLALVKVAKQEPAPNASAAANVTEAKVEEPKADVSKLVSNNVTGKEEVPVVAAANVTEVKSEVVENTAAPVEETAAAPAESTVAPVAAASTVIAVNVTEPAAIEADASNDTSAPAAVAATEANSTDATTEVANATVEDVSADTNATVANVSEMSAPATNETVAAAPAEAEAQEPAEPAEPMAVVSAADMYSQVNRNLAQVWKANRARFVARELEEEAEAAAEHAAEEEATQKAAAAQQKAEQEAQAAAAARAEQAEAAKRAAQAAEVAPTPASNTSLTDAYTETNHVTTPAPKAKAQKVSEQVEAEDMPAEPKFPTDWIKNDMKYNADVDTMAQREKSIQDRVKEQQAWKAKGQSWIQTKVFHLRS
jgi:ABC-2 type transport system ATP-binding protein